VLDDKEGWELLGSRLKKVKHAATLAVPPLYVEQYGMYTNPARATLIDKIKIHNAEIELLDINQHLARLRMIKQPEELLAIQEAIDITTATIKQATTSAKLNKYTHEYQIESELSRGFRNRGATGHAFEPIVAGGERACTLHNVANNGELSADELVLIDTGADVEHYAADITRTMSTGNPSRRQLAVHAAVVEAQNFALSLLRPGVVLKDYEQQIEHFIGEKMRELGLIKSITHEEVRRFYPHSTSHFLGLNVHDVGDYDRPLEPGVVITVEPGIYIHEESIGIRIEDDILITETGNKVLSKKLPRSLS
jgi:Xaa-Pro aminopeptidase